jgi:hypothetical protein
MKIVFVLAISMLMTASLHAAPPALGIDAPLIGKQVFPKDDPWNTDISSDPVDPASTAIIARIGASRPLPPDFGTVYNGAPSGIPYIVVPGNTPKRPIAFTDSPDESDNGPYPIPPDAPIEGGPRSDGDRHVLVIDRDHWMLYELWEARPLGGSEGGGRRWQAGSGAIFDLKHDTIRPAGWTSADAAGLPIFPGLVRYDEVMGLGKITHALRFTVRKTRRAYVAPARHFASKSTDPALPPMGMRVRLKADFDIAPFPEPVQVILIGLKHYGMFLADNGSDWYISGAPDERWNDSALHQLSKVKGSDLEVVRMGALTTR